MKKFLFILFVLVLGACGSTPNVRRQDMSFLNDEISVPVASVKSIEIPKTVKVVKTTAGLSDEDKEILAASLGKDTEPESETFVCSHDKVMRKPIVIIVQKFDLDEESDSRQSNGGKMVLKTCCEARQALASDDERLIASCE